MKQLFTLAALLVGAVSTATAESHPTCMLRVIHAHDQVMPGVETQASAEMSAPHIDPKIDRLRPYLLRPPFTSWREFKLLDARTFELTPHVAQSFPLPNGKILSVTYLEHLPDTKTKHHRVRLQLEIGAGTPASLKTIFIVDEGGLVLQAGQPHHHGMLVVGTSCTEAD